jgi:hypothetical protein
VPVDPAQPWRVESDLARLDLDLQSHRPSLLDRSSHSLTSQPTNEEAGHGQVVETSRIRTHCFERLPAHRVGSDPVGSAVPEQRIDGR